MENNKIKGIRTSHLFYPIITLITIIQIVIVTCTIFINYNTAEMSDESKRQSDATNDITLILSSSSKLSDTVINFSYTPELPGGRINIGPLNAYLDEISSMETDISVLEEKIRSYSINDDIMDIVDNALNSFSRLLEYHAHSFYLINYALKDDVLLNKNVLSDVISFIPEYELSEDELNYTKEEALSSAHNLLFDQDYSINKGNISTYVNEALNKFSSESISKIEKNQKVIQVSRYILWDSIAFAMLLLVFFFILLIRFIVQPITSFSNKIDQNERLSTNGRLHETNVLADAYNDLLDRHKEFENELRNVAEKDSLTGLPNRYSYNEFLKKPIEESKRVCVFLLDLNELKYTNDNYGHSEGDELINRASKCIKECFKDGISYRIGGDEFLSIITDIDKEEIDKYVNNFVKLQEKYNVSIAIGYSYSDDVLNVGYEKLAIEADKMMYENKKQMKNQ